MIAMNYKMIMLHVKDKAVIISNVEASKRANVFLSIFKQNEFLHILLKRLSRMLCIE